jgi:hypothetical protein
MPAIFAPSSGCTPIGDCDYRLRPRRSLSFYWVVYLSKCVDTYRITFQAKLKLMYC